MPRFIRRDILKQSLRISFVCGNVAARKIRAYAVRAPQEGIRNDRRHVDRKAVYLGHILHVRAGRFRKLAALLHVGNAAVAKSKRRVRALAAGAVRHDDYLVGVIGEAAALAEYERKIFVRKVHVLRIFKRVKLGAKRLLRRASLYARYLSRHALTQDPPFLVAEDHLKRRRYFDRVRLLSRKSLAFK